MLINPMWQDSWPKACSAVRGIPGHGENSVTGHHDFWLVPDLKPLGITMQQKSKFTACAMELPVLTAWKPHVSSPEAHTRLFPLSIHSPAFLGPTMKAKKSLEVTEKLFFLIQCDSLTQISLCLWISLCYQLFSRLIAAMATAHHSAQTQAEVLDTILA